MDTKTLAPKVNKVAFENFESTETGIFLWVNMTLLPAISASVPRENELNFIADACHKVEKEEIDDFENDDFSIVYTEEKQYPGVFLEFNDNISSEVANLFINSPNSAVAKIGYQIRNGSNSAPSTQENEITWRGKNFFYCGTNNNARSVTLTFNKSALIQISNMNPKNEICQFCRELSNQLDILDN